MKSKTNGRATTQNEKLILYILGVASIFALCYLLIIFPASDKTKNLKTEIKALENQLVSVRSIDYDIDLRKKELETLMVEYNASTDTLPKSDRFPEVYKQVHQMVGESGLTPANGSFGLPAVIEVVGQNGEGTSNVTGLRKIQLTYSLSGDRDKLLTFIDKLEKHTRIAEVNSFSITGESCSIVFSFYDTGEGEKEEYDFN